MITITYSSIDGFRKTRRFKTLSHARGFAEDYVGPQDVEGGHYAVSHDGVGKIVWSGCTRRELFGQPSPGVVLNQETTFYSRGDDLFCRQKGYTFDHVHQDFGHVVEINGFWKLRNLVGDCRNILNEEATFSTRAAALSSARKAMTDYLSYLESDNS